MFAASEYPCTGIVFLFFQSSVEYSDGIDAKLAMRLFSAIADLFLYIIMFSRSQ